MNMRWKGTLVTKLKKAELMEALHQTNDMLQRVMQRQSHPPLVMTDRAQAKVDEAVAQFKPLFGRLYWK